MSKTTTVKSADAVHADVLGSICQAIVRRQRFLLTSHARPDGDATLLPVSLGLGYVMLRDGLPPINAFASGEWTAYRRHAPVSPAWTVRLGVTVAFPHWRPW